MNVNVLGCFRTRMHNELMSALCFIHVRENASANIPSLPFATGRI